LKIAKGIENWKQLWKIENRKYKRSETLEISSLEFTGLTGLSRSRLARNLIKYLLQYIIFKSE